MQQPIARLCFWVQLRARDEEPLDCVTQAIDFALQQACGTSDGGVVANLRLLFERVRGVVSAVGANRAR